MVGVPTSAGAFGIGQEQTPAVLRELGIVPLLRRAGVDIVDGGDVSGKRMRPDPTHPKMQNLEDVVAIVTELRDRVAGILAGGDRAFVVGGDCTITLGVVAAAVDIDPETHLLYFDGDADISTPATTRSGILDAMGLGHLLDLDGAADLLAGIGGRKPLLPGAAVTLVGYETEDLTDDQAGSLQDRGVHLFPAARLRGELDATLQDVSSTLSRDTSRVVHFDVDAVDSIDSPLAHYPHFNTGVSLASATRALKEFCRPPGLAALVVTEVNPLHDPDRVELRRLVDALAAALAAAA